ncbi:transcriptional regulator, TetR family [Aliiroseovarius sediminilitoris]|uniref:Transcriptional regulator, TetR family n=1 Tax=Aliiroseovarius sediminilitoris TaxID=1173584 RepID=A0A1I0PD76_9RHOB|nr:TetR family transcriptional regulator C-terminal domain-containing protein [Aliiroseovarius sediminilitoris]SEW12331.1 transcriptional regulator, TetR family [Aliiroseovarius sediminilitoris]
MTQSHPKFRREPAEQRKEALILAALALIAERGVRGATVRAIAERADVTQGLIRHYFSSKEDLISAAYAFHMSHMTNLTAAPNVPDGATASVRLAAFVAAGLNPPVVDPASVSLWASFLNKVREDPRMRQIHEQTYHDFRDRLEGLIADALAEAELVAPPARLRHLAIACNAVIDGLWMEGGALPNAFEPGELPKIGLQSVGAIIGIDLQETGNPS